MTLPDSILVVDVCVDVEVEDDWNEWYEEVHLPAILKCPYVLSGKRYVYENTERRYLTVYSLSSEEAVTTPEFQQARGWGDFSENVRFTTRLYRRVKRGRG